MPKKAKDGEPEWYEDQRAHELLLMYIEKRFPKKEKKTQAQLAQMISQAIGTDVSPQQVQRRIKTLKEETKTTSQQQQQQRKERSPSPSIDDNAESGLKTDLRTKRLEKTLILVPEPEGGYRKYMKHSAAPRQSDNADTYVCVRCHQVNIKEKDKRAKKESTHYVMMCGSRVVEMRQKHHPECQPLSDTEAAVEQLKRMEFEFVSAKMGKAWDANKQTIWQNTALVAEEFGISEEELFSAFQAYPKRRKKLWSRHSTKVPTYSDPFAVQEYITKPRNQDWFCASSKEDGLLLLSTDDELGYLAESNKLVLDATFQTVPDPFTQMFCIHAEIGSNFGACAHILMERRTTEHYVIALNMLKKEIEQKTKSKWCPEIIVTDFETPMQNALKIVFPDAQLKGCRFHFAAAFYKNIVRLGLQDEYRKGPGHELYDWARQVMALKTLPTEIAYDFWERHLEKGPFPHIERAEQSQEIHELLTYTSKTWFADRKFEIEKEGWEGDKGPHTINGKTAQLALYMLVPKSTQEENEQENQPEPEQENQPEPEEENQPEAEQENQPEPDNTEPDSTEEDEDEEYEEEEEVPEGFFDWADED